MRQSCYYKNTKQHETSLRAQQSQNYFMRIASGQIKSCCSRMNIVVIIFTFIILFTGNMVHSQSRIMVENELETLVFGHFSDALNAAEPGAIIYLPGGAIDIGTSYIEKELTIYGVGHHPDYTEATGVTMLNGTLYMRQADPDIPLENIHLEGFYISGDIRIGTSTTNQNVKQVNIRRCSMRDLYLSRTTDAIGEADQIHIIENVIRGRVYGGYAQNVLFSKNIIEGLFWYFEGNALFTNNIFLNDQTASTVSTSFRYITNSTFRNNVIRCVNSSRCFNNMSANNFNNNMWRYDFSVPSGSTGTDNIINLDPDEIFVNAIGNTFNYEFNYQLSESSPGIGAGTDDTDIGIFGTTRPLKEGFVPVIPYIKSKSISTETDEEGKISVEVEVEAQEE